MTINTPLIRKNVVSVIIPIYNHDRYIVECLESIKRAKHDRIEIIAIDDGSSDESFELAKSWLDENAQRFVLVKCTRQANAGITKTLNRLVRQSTGEFIFPLASDDQVKDNGISQLLQYYKKSCHSPTLLLSDVELIDLNGCVAAASGAEFLRRKERLLVHSKTYLSLDILTSWGTPFQHQFYPRVLFDSLGGYDEGLAYEDVYFALTNVARGSVAYAPVKSRRYRIRPNLVTTPGISPENISAVPSRCAVAPQFSPAYRALISLLNVRDRAPDGVKRQIAAKLIALLRRGISAYIRVTTSGTDRNSLAS